MEPPVNDDQLWKTRSVISTSAIEAITNDAPRTRSEANPIGTASTATSTPDSAQATKLGTSARVARRAVP